MKLFNFAALALLSAALSPLRAQDKAPHIVFDKEIDNFGKIAEGESLKHIFRFTNKGTATLEVLSVEPS